MRIIYNRTKSHENNFRKKHAIFFTTHWKHKKKTIVKRTHTNTRTHANIDIYTHVHAHTQTYIHMFISIYINIYIYIYIYMSFGPLN